MANSEHLALVQQGVEVWNSWYKKHKHVIPDLAQANLSSLNLSGINFKKAILKQANFSNTDLSKSQLNNANLEKVNLLGANLDSTNFKGANLDFAILSKATTNRQTVMLDKYLRVHEIVNNIGTNKDLAGVDLSNSNLFKANLSNAELSHAKLVNVNLSNANLNNAYLYKADLTGANLQNADLRNAYFSQANLTSVYLSGALCCGAYFKDAELKFANLKAAKLSHKTMIDLKWHSVWEIVNRGAAKKNLSGADLSNANLQGVDFEEANLTNAKLSNAILRRSNLTNANLTNTDLVGANVCGVDLDRANLKGAKLKSMISDRYTQLSATSGSKTNLMVKEKPALEPTNTPILESPTKIQSPLTTQDKDPKMSKKSTKNWWNIFWLGIIATFAAGGYIFWTQNPDYPWSAKLETWKGQLEQLIPQK